MLKEAIAKAVRGQDLSEDEMQAALGQIMEGLGTQAQIGALLVALRMKGECVEEITGAARAMRSRAQIVPSLAREKGETLLDTCGTGGDGAGTFNVSTATALVAAAAGARVAKHGNRSVSSQCGSADLMEGLGVNLSLDPGQVGRCIDEVGLGFLFAPSLHLAMRHAVGPRRELGMRTIFNVLGPLTNPAGAQAQVLGVYDPGLVETLALVLAKLGSQSALVVHGHGGLDEISISGPTLAARLENGQVSMLTIKPQDAGLPLGPAEDIRGGDLEANALMARQVLQGQKGTARDMVLLNAAAALVVCGLAQDLREGAQKAAQAIDSGAAWSKLQTLAGFSHDLARQAQESSACG